MLVLILIVFAFLDGFGFLHLLWFTTCFLYCSTHAGINELTTPQKNLRSGYFAFSMLSGKYSFSSGKCFTYGHAFFTAYSDQCSLILRSVTSFLSKNCLSSASSCYKNSILHVFSVGKNHSTKVIEGYQV